MRWVRLIWSMFRARFASALPVTSTSQVHFRVWITDIDVSVMNHAAIMTVFETGRIDFMVRTGFFRLASRNKWYVPSSAISVQFFRPLKVFQKATVHTRLFHIDDRWIYLEQLITRSGKQIAGCIVKSTVKQGREVIDPAIVLQQLGASAISSDGAELVQAFENENALLRERLAGCDENFSLSKKRDAMKTPVRFAVADDHAVFRKALAGMFEAKGMTLLAEGRNGKELILNLQPDNLPDIVFLDLSMPVMDGIATASYLSQHHPGVKLIGMCMEEDEQQFRAEMGKVGFWAFFRKTDPPEDIIELTQKVFKQRSIQPITLLPWHR